MHATGSKHIFVRHNTEHNVWKRNCNGICDKFFYTNIRTCICVQSMMCILFVLQSMAHLPKSQSANVHIGHHRKSLLSEASHWGIESLLGKKKKIKKHGEPSKCCAAYDAGHMHRLTRGATWWCRSKNHSGIYTSGEAVFKSVPIFGLACFIKLLVNNANGMCLV